MVRRVAHVEQTAALLVSELATNATQHAQGVAGRGVEVVVTRRDDRLRVEVRDGSQLLPVLRHSDALDEGGRGLLLVGALADGYGADALADGKSAWFELLAWGQAAGGT